MLPKPAEPEVPGPVLVLAPLGRDADAIARVLADMGLKSDASSDVRGICRSIGETTPMLLLAEEGLAHGMNALVSCLEHQPLWSDLPIIV